MSAESGSGVEEPEVEDLMEPAIPVFEPPSRFRPLQYVGVVMNLPSTNPTLVLREEDDPHRELHIPIALADGVAISFAAGRVATPKPLTHELLTNIFDAYGLTLEQVRIIAVDNSAYSAELVLSGSLGSRVLECRVTDGVCLALRQRLDVPVTAAEEVLFQASMASREP